MFDDHKNISSMGFKTLRSDIDYCMGKIDNSVDKPAYEQTVLKIDALRRNLEEEMDLI